MYFIFFILDSHILSSHLCLSTGDVIGYEGGSVTLSCTFTTSSTATYILYWYIHHLNGSPKYILQRYTSGAGDTAAEFKDRFDAKIEKTAVPLTIQREIFYTHHKLSEVLNCFVTSIWNCASE
uniref:Immunoglobulin V-set domain-containing protein n=1 Tax=Scleropages formosus TaxID=113540 RepID=A0A8C9VBQ9_SCLFO